MNFHFTSSESLAIGWWLGSNAIAQDQQQREMAALRSEVRASHAALNHFDGRGQTDPTLPPPPRPARPAPPLSRFANAAWWKVLLVGLGVAGVLVTIGAALMLGATDMITGLP